LRNRSRLLPDRHQEKSFRGRKKAHSYVWFAKKEWRAGGSVRILNQRPNVSKREKKRIQGTNMKDKNRRKERQGGSTER